MNYGVAVMRGVNGASCARDRGSVLYLADVTAVISLRVLAVGQVGCVYTMSRHTVTFVK